MQLAQPHSHRESEPGSHRESQPRSHRESQSCSHRESQLRSRRKKRNSQLERESFCLRLISYSTFEQLSTLSKAVKPEVNSKFSLKVKKLTIQDVQGELDATAAALYPEVGTLGLFPMKVGTDGNSCPRALSVLAYGTEVYDIEMRCRLIVELASEEEKYLTPSNSELEQESLNTLASMSEEFSDNLSPAGIKFAFRQETLASVQAEVFMGLWQLFAAAEMFKCTIDVVYPVKGGEVLRRMHHRKIQPLQPCPSLTLCLHLMWSTSREDQTVEHWTANYILPLLPASEEDMPHDELNTEVIHHEESGDCGPRNHAISPEISAFYSITWRDGKRYICQALDVDEHGQMILLKFMAQRGDLYFWPRPRDTSWEPFKSIEQKVRNIILNEEKSTQRVQYFTVHFLILYTHRVIKSFQVLFFVVVVWVKKKFSKIIWSCFVYILVVDECCGELVMWHVLWVYSCNHALVRLIWGGVSQCAWVCGCECVCVCVRVRVCVCV